MAGKAGLKAGLIGAAILLVLTLLSQIPALGCVCCGVSLLAYAGIGVLAGFFLTPPRNAGLGAGAGAIAGVISGAVAGLVEVIVSVIQLLITGPGQFAGAIPPEQMEQLTELGMDPEMFALFTGTGGVALAGGLCCLGSLALGAALGAIGGTIFAAAKSD
jgi:hypothetical protein